MAKNRGRNPHSFRRKILLQRERAKELVERSKVKYDAAVNEPESLMTKRDELKKEELVTAIMNSGKSYDEILKFIKDDI